MESHPIENLWVTSDFVVGRDRAIESSVNIENTRNATYACKYAFLLCEDGSCGTLVRIDTGITRGIARGAVFE
jgi:hypothetical protein